ncbi:MAG: hypothetical protein JWO13_421 [Acidobacteriales bacterium]|nr:hypothetical protein [Terriglobales bacterium]
MTDGQQLLFRGAKRLGRFLTASPFFVFLVLAVPAWLLLIAAALLRIGSIPLAAGRDVGFFHSGAWSISYPFLFPVGIAMFARLATLICKRLALVADRKVIVNSRGGADPKGLLAEIGVRMEPASRVIMVLAALTACFILVIDTAHLFSAAKYLQSDAQYQQSHNKPYEILDWTFAYAENGPSTIYHGDGRDGPVTDPTWRAPSRGWNATFDVVAWAMEGLYLFLGIEWVLTYGWFLKTFADLLIGADARLIFVPQWGFHDLNLGLKPIGILYDLYLGAIVILGGVAAWHRVSYVTINCHATYPNLGSYIQALVNAYRAKSLTDVDHRVFAMDCMTKIDWLYLLGYGIAVYVIIYFPMIRLKKYISSRLEELKQSRVREYEATKARGDEASARALIAEIEAYSKANIWPNGDDTALIFMIVILSLYLVCLTPASMALFAALCTTLGLWKAILEPVWARLK